MKTLMTSVKVFLVMTLLTGVAYPLFITGIAQLVFTNQAKGSLIHKKESFIGSALIAQKFVSEKYFWPRPSAINYNPLAPSGGSNLGPTSRRLQELVKERKEKLHDSAPTELLYASASGLDPHISVETAYAQMERVAKARNVDIEKVKKIIDFHAEGPLWYFLGPKYVNVLLINQALDE